MSARPPLDGVALAVESDQPAALACARQLERMGAARGAGAAQIVLTDEPQGASGRVQCVFERHRLSCGGLVASEATAQAAAGLTDYVGPAGGRAARVGCDIAEAITGVFAAQAVLASLYAERDGAPPRPVRVSGLRTLATLKTILWAARARPDAWTGTHVRSRERAVDAGYRTADGRITLDFAPGAKAGWSAFAAELGLTAGERDALHGRWWESVGWGDDVDEARPCYEERLRRLSSQEAMALIRRHGGSSVPFLTPAECLAQPQSQAVGLPRALAEGLPWRTTSAPGPRAPARAPGTLPLAGVRVVDFGVGGVGPFAAALLAWLGADVVKVEAPSDFIMAVRPSAGGISTTYLALNQGKRSVALDLKDDGDLALARDLVAGADVLVENFRPGVLDRLGLGFDELRRLNPSIVACSATGFGWQGPLAAEPCTDPHMQAFSGFAWRNADPADDVPRRIRYYGFVDLVTSAVIAEAACAALLQRSRDGGALRVETSMLHAVSDAQAATDAGAPRRAPDDVYRARDGCVAITCRDEDEWTRLVDALDRPPALLEPELAQRSGRAAHPGTLRRALETRLAELPAAAWEQRLAGAGIPCTRVLRDEEVLGRRELWDWEMLRELPLAHAPPLVAGGPPWRFEGSVAPPPAPYPGADTPDLRAATGDFWR